MSGESNRFGLTDAQQLVSDSDYVRKGAYFQSLPGVAVTRMGNGDWHYTVGTAGLTVTLPDPADEVGHLHTVKHASDISNSGATKIVTAAATLDGSATHSMAGANAVRAYFSTGDAWRATSAVSGGNAEVNSGTYTPSVSLSTNVTVANSQAAQWMRVGKAVTVSGGVNVKATAAAGTQSEVEVALPVASVLASTIHLAGGVNAQGANEAGIAYADVVSNRARLRWLSQTSATHTMWFNFTYRVV